MHEATRFLRTYILGTVLAGAALVGAAEAARAGGCVDVTLTTQAQVDAFSCTEVSGSLTIEGADAPIGHTIDTEFSQSLQAVMTVTFDDLLPEGAVVRVGTAPGLSNLTEFTVGSYVDTEPPKWRGGLSRKSHRQPKDCAYGASHRFTFRGVSDDHTDRDHLLIKLEPVDVGNTVWGNMRRAYVVEDGCGVPVSVTVTSKVSVPEKLAGGVYS